MANYLRTHRKKAGLSQRELSIILGYGQEGSVCRHERFQTMPSLQAALSYEIIFGVPVSEIFVGLRDTISVTVEQRLTVLEDNLGQRSGKGRQAASTAQKLEWLLERRGYPQA